MGVRCDRRARVCGDANTRAGASIRHIDRSTGSGASIRRPDRSTGRASVARRDNPGELRHDIC